MTTLKGIHHVTAIGADAQRNVDFYSGVLGLRLVKKTVNFDDPGSYHLYYGDRVGTPGTLVTFFIWPGATNGQSGAGEPVALAFEVPEGSIGGSSDSVKLEFLYWPRDRDLERPVSKSAIQTE
jgi:glyoxalase family protein